MNTAIPPLPSEDEILDAVLDVALTARAGRRFPPIRTQEWLELPYEDKVASLLVLACAWLAEDPRRAERAAMSQVSNDVHGGHDWARYADQGVTPGSVEGRRLQRAS